MKEHDHSQGRSSNQQQASAQPATSSISTSQSGIQGHIVQLQRAMGNRAVMQMLRDQNGQYANSGIIKPAMPLQRTANPSTVIQRLGDHDAQKKITKKKPTEWQGYLQGKLEKAKNNEDAKRYLRYFSSYTDPIGGWETFYRIPWEEAVKKNDKIGIYPPDNESKEVRAPLIDQKITKVIMELNSGSGGGTVARALKTGGAGIGSVLGAPDKITEAIEKGGASAFTKLSDKASIAMASRYGAFSDESESKDVEEDDIDEDVDKGDIEPLVGAEGSMGGLVSTGAKATAKFLAKKAAGIPVNLVKALVGLPLTIAEGVVSTIEGIGTVAEVSSMSTQVKLYYQKLALIESPEPLFDTSLRDGYIEVLDLLKRNKVFASAKEATSSGLSMGGASSSSGYSEATGSELHDDASGVGEDSRFSDEVKKHQSLKGIASKVQDVKGLVGKSSTQKNRIASVLSEGLNAPLDTDKTIAQRIVVNILGIGASSTYEEIRESI